MTDQLAAVLLFIVPVPAAAAIHAAIDVVIGWFASAPDSLEEVAA